VYTTKNFATKKQLKEAVTAGELVTIYQPGGLFNPPEASSTYTGVAYLEGPHYPEPHRWYAEATLKDGIVVKVK
jgi:hypothetical protein